MFTSGEPVLRQGWSGRYWEELSLEDEHVRLDRLRSGRAPVLHMHGFSGLDNPHIGVVEKAWWEGEGADRVGVARLRLSQRDSLSELWQDIRDGIAPNVSIGYRVLKYLDVTRRDPEGDALEEKRLRAVDWEPVEISSVWAGADSAAAMRSEALVRVGGEPASRVNECTLVRFLPQSSDRGGGSEQVEPMADETRGQDAAAPPADAASVDVQKERQEAVAQERERRNGIEALAKRFGIDEELRSQLVDGGSSVAEARAAVLDWLERSHEKQVGSQQSAVDVTVVRDAADKATEALRCELARRFHVETEAEGSSEVARDFRGLSILEMGREYLRARNLPVPTSRHDLAGVLLGLTRATGGMGTSDFPGLLQETGNRRLRRRWELRAPTYRAIARASTAPDFRPLSRYQISTGSKLMPKNEHNEYMVGKFSESKESYRIETFGRLFPWTREMAINDDLSALTRFIDTLANKARTKEEDLAWAIITSNPTMGDGEQLFSSAHGNLNSTSGAMSDATIGNLITLFRKQTDPDGEFLDLPPATLIVPVKLERLARQLFSPNSPDSVDNVVVTRQILRQVVSNPRLDVASETAFYLACSPDDWDILEYAYLDGNEGPMLESEVKFETDGIVWKIRLDFGVAPIDYRGIASADGAT